MLPRQAGPAAALPAAALLVTAVDSDPSPAATAEPSVSVAAAASAAAGAPLSGWVDIAHRGGLTVAGRWLARTPTGRSLFVKAGDNAIAREIDAYEKLAGHPWMATIVGASTGTRAGPVLVLEDLSGAVWPPPWTPPLIKATRSEIARIAGTRPPAGTPTIGDLDPVYADRWPTIDDPVESLAALGFADRQWARAHLPALVAAAARFDRSGSSLCHLDIWSDNVCWVPATTDTPDGRIVVTDWTDWAVGNPLVMLAEWAVQTSVEPGGLPPGSVIGPAAGAASWLTGRYVGLLAAEPSWMDAPNREHLDRKVPAVLRWACDSLGLPPPETTA